MAADLQQQNVNDSADNPFSFAKFVNKTDNETNGRKIEKPKLNLSIKKLQIVDDDDDDSDEISQSSSESSIKEVEEALNGSDDNDEYILPDPTPQNGQVEKLEQLTKENESLRNLVKRSKKEFLEYKLTANKRIGALQKELEKTRNKEADETRTLESVVRMVEENLQTTTKRAASAEEAVSRLNKEVNRLKKDHEESKKRASNNYNILLCEHNELLAEVEDKSKDAARLLRTAANKTEPHVRQLQCGISSLHFLASQFDDLGKITETSSNSL